MSPPLGIAEAAARTGAFPLATGSRSAALVASLAPGLYSFHAPVGGDAAGEVLLEIYVIDE